jgi:hypothetical protein
MAMAWRLPPTATRVERHTPMWINEAIRARSDVEVARLEDAGEEEIERRLEQLEREWDIERALQLNASIVASVGLLLSAQVDRRFLWLPAAVFVFFAQHALQGWCPPVPLMRRLGVRTAREIAREVHAIKALRGDFDHVPREGSAEPGRRVRAALHAVDL